LVGFLAVVAVRLLQLRGFARTDPERYAHTMDIDPLFLRLLAARLNRDPTTLTIAQFWRDIAMLGGFIGRKSNGAPGWQTLWDG
jgi:hypothetical protein